MQGGSSDRSSPTPDSAYHLPTTGDTVRLDSPTANQSLLSKAAEVPGRWLGLTRRFGSPVIARADRRVSA